VATKHSFKWGHDKKHPIINKIKLSGGRIESISIPASINRGSIKSRSKSCMTVSYWGSPLNYRGFHYYYA